MQFSRALKAKPPILVHTLNSILLDYLLKSPFPHNQFKFQSWNKAAREQT